MNRLNRGASKSKCLSIFQAQADLDAKTNAVLIQHLKLENEGWERDYSVGGPSEPAV